MAPPGNQAATENTNLNLRVGKDPVYSPAGPWQERKPIRCHLLQGKEAAQHRMCEVVQGLGRKRDSRPRQERSGFALSRAATSKPFAALKTASLQPLIAPLRLDRLPRVPVLVACGFLPELIRTSHPSGSRHGGSAPRAIHPGPWLIRAPENRRCPARVQAEER